MVCEIKNNHLTVQIKSKGAELTSIKKTGDEHEYLWQGEEPFWNRQSPILFPFIGSLLDDEYIYQDKIFKMSRHGFVRDAEFLCDDISDTRVRFKYVHNDETMKVFPFEFEFYVTYEVTEVLSVTFEVENHSSMLMPFCIGGHPAFNWDLNNETSLSFDIDNAPSYTVESDGIGIGPIENLEHYELATDIFVKDTFMYAGVGSVVFRNGVRGVEIDCSDFPYLAIWSQVGAPFVCLEPWYGLPDLVGHNKEVLDKIGIVKLLKAEKFITSYTIKVLS